MKATLAKSLDIMFHWEQDLQLRSITLKPIAWGGAGCPTEYQASFALCSASNFWRAQESIHEMSFLLACAHSTVHSIGWCAATGEHRLDKKCNIFLPAHIPQCTALDAVALGYKVKVLLDGCAATNETSGADASQEMVSRGVELCCKDNCS